MSQQFYYMTWEEVDKRLKKIPSFKKMYGVPRGGEVVAGLKSTAGFYHAPTAADADIVVDDIIDSGATMKRVLGSIVGRRKLPKFYALVDKRVPKDKALGWVVFPWESKDASSDIADTVVRQLEFLGENPKREGLVDTPKRVVEALKEMTAGLHLDPTEHLKVTFNEKCDEMVVVRDIPYFSLCEHHLLPFFGKVTVAYLPNRSVVGLSKVPRMIDGYARRPQVQERFTQQIADAMEKTLKPFGVGVLVTGSHMCQRMRGVKSEGEMLTCALRGAFRTDPMARAEFMALKK